eukprot:TRINITY_DN1835_c0_g2_i2.p2 TRINITY_DN1835_c0_g2~~TRINITY_DN1835_c0_g2_i2.p2  ORF type:complete len:353 (+),score=70.95 TRINITY_DN1835_c0_g2_i2:2262-3320(+)
MVPDLPDVISVDNISLSSFLSGEIRVQRCLSTVHVMASSNHFISIPSKAHDSTNISSGKWALVQSVTSLDAHFVSQIAFSIFKCSDGRLDLLEDIECWEGYHGFMVFSAVLTLLIFLPTCLRLSEVNGDMNRVAVYFWKTWSFDQPDVRKIHRMSRQSAKFNRSQLISKLLMLLYVLFAGESAPKYLSATVLLLTTLLMSMATIQYPPFHDKYVNYFRFGSLAAVAWTNICAFVVVHVNDTKEVWTTILYLVILPVSAFIGMFLMRWQLEKMRAQQREDVIIDMEEAEHSDDESEVAAQQKKHCPVCNTDVSVAWWPTHAQSLKHKMNEAAAKPSDSTIKSNTVVENASFDL